MTALAPHPPTFRGELSHRVRRLGIETGQEPVVYLRRDSSIVRSEGFDSQTRVELRTGERRLRATLAVVTAPLLEEGEAGLSEAAWARLGVGPGSRIRVRHPRPLPSLRHVRAKIHGQRLDGAALAEIIRDVAAGEYSDIHIASFLTACAGERLDRRETIDLTRTMVSVGERLTWSGAPVLDKHSVGGLPGNRTTLVIVPIIAAAGHLIPKTSSRAITSPAGSADTMETLAPVELDTAAIRRVVEREGGCIVCGPAEPGPICSSGWSGRWSSTGPAGRLRALQEGRRRLHPRWWTCPSAPGRRSPRRPTGAGARSARRWGCGSGRCCEVGPARIALATSGAGGPADARPGGSPARAVRRRSRRRGPRSSDPGRRAPCGSSRPSAGEGGMRTPPGGPAGHRTRPRPRHRDRQPPARRVLDPAAGLRCTCVWATRWRQHAGSRGESP